MRLKHPPAKARPFESIMRRKKCTWLLDALRDKDAKILEVGCGSSWVGRFLAENGYTGYRGLDIDPPADVVGSIKDWQALGLEPDSFDCIIAFEIVEHVDCFAECRALLKPGGQLLVTTPVPTFDWLLYLLESTGLNQKRTSAHSNLVDLRTVTQFADRHVRKHFFMSQWGTFNKAL